VIGTESDELQLLMLPDRSLRALETEKKDTKQIMENRSSITQAPDECPMCDFSHSFFAFHRQINRDCLPGK